MVNCLFVDLGVVVLLIESGLEYDSLLIIMLCGIGKLFSFGNLYVWDYQVQCGEGMFSEQWFKGRIFGGFSLINGMVYVCGVFVDYDVWEVQGCIGWGWQDMGWQFVVLEDYQFGGL